MRVESYRASCYLQGLKQKKRKRMFRAEICKDAAGHECGIDLWMTACPQGRPESLNRGGVETVTTGNGRQPEQRCLER